MKWQKKSGGKLYFLTIIHQKMPKSVKNGHFWLFGNLLWSTPHPKTSLVTMFILYQQIGMKWQKRSAGKLHFLTKTLGKTPKKVKNGYFWSFCDPHGQPLHPTVQDLVQIVRLTTIFNNSKAKMLSFSFFSLFFDHFHRLFQ